ncbi:efflux RND transporter periplasmic adaptor subunit [Myxococcota bacterium]|nr:efflux RND transporter periplasmic adaptor subunit [Myxococcota bacterium]MBU1380750.1 efflux RND transporter periplasmic adaptor subunit [Myxococcota bacterium]MBU1498022.1 efflux RND transporter periplasmic adaptor subunit [Myxococcota bacterium]
MKKSRLFFTIAVSILSLSFLIYFSGCSAGANANNRDEIKIVEQAVNVVTAKKQDYRPVIKTVGKAGPVREVILGMEMSGKLISFNLNAGDWVKKGQPVARVKTIGLWSQHNQAKSRVNEISTSLEQTTRDYKKMKELRKQGVISQRDFELSELQYKSQNLQLETARATLGQVNESLTGTHLLAPFDGQISSVHQNQGNLVSAGSPLARLIDLSTVRIKTGISESDVMNVKVGDKVEVQSVTWGGRTWVGEVKFISPAADPASGTFPVTIEFKNNIVTNGTEQRWMINDGMTMKISFFKPAVNGYIIPVESVLERNGKKYVYVVSKKTASMKSVTPLMMIENSYLVTGDFADGSMIVVSGAGKLRNNSIVKTVPLKTAI